MFLSIGVLVLFCSLSENNSLNKNQINFELDLSGLNLNIDWYEVVKDEKFELSLLHDIVLRLT